MALDRSLRQTLTYVFTIASTQALSFLLLPVVTNYLSPEVYGDYALALSVSSLVGTLGSAWIRNVAFRLFFKARAAGDSRAFFLSVAVSQAAVVVALFSGATVFLARTSQYVPTAVMVAAGLAQLTNDFYAVTLTLVRAEQRTVHYTVAEIGSTIVRFAGTFAGLALGFRSPALLFLAPAAGSALLGAYAVHGLNARLSGRAGFQMAVVRDLVRYGPVSIPFSIAGWGERLMVRIVLDKFLSRAVVGVYAANFSLADRLIGGLIQAVFFMFWPDVLRSFSDKGKDAARQALTRGLRLYFWLTTGPTVFVAVFHEEIAMILGHAYREGSEIMPVIAAATWIHGFTRFLNRHLELNLRFATLSAIAIGGAVLNLVLSIILVPRLGIMGGALSTLGNFTATLAYFWMIRDRELVRMPMDTIANVVLLLAGALVLSRLPASGFQRAAVFVVVYGAGAAFFVMRQFWARKQVKIAA